MMSIDEIKDQLKELFIRNFPKSADSPVTFDDEAPLRSSSLELDSIDLLLLVLEIEKKFGVRLASDEYDESIWTSVSSLALAIQARIQASSAGKV